MIVRAPNIGAQTGAEQGLVQRGSMHRGPGDAENKASVGEACVKTYSSLYRIDP